jgi:hypothetical protein
VHGVPQRNDGPVNVLTDRLKYPLSIAEKAQVKDALWMRHGLPIDYGIARPQGPVAGPDWVCVRIGAIRHADSNVETYLM